MFKIVTLFSIFLSLVIISCDSGYKKTNTNANDLSKKILDDKKKSDAEIKKIIDNQEKLYTEINKVAGPGYYNAKQNVSVYDKPDIGSLVISSLFKNSLVYTNNFSGDWAKIKIFSIYGEKDGYVQIEYLEKNSNITNKKTYSAGSSYSYSVSGNGDNGYVYGDVDVDKNGGSGIIYDENGKEIEINVDWDGRHSLTGYDDEGNSYDLDVD